MLIDKRAFDELENVLNEKGKISEFEKIEGDIKGRMMITLSDDIPKELDIKLETQGDYYIFIGSFDFYDSSVGVVYDRKSSSLASGIWITPQVVDATPPSKEWIEFFIMTLAKNVIEEEGFGIPIYCFLTDEADMTIVPTSPDSEF